VINGGEFSKMTLTDSDEVIVAGRSTERNIIYRLSSNLSELDNVFTNGTVRGLSLTNGGEYVMVCIDADGLCSGYNVTDFNDTLNRVWITGDATSENDSVAMFPGEAEGDVYVGIAAVTTGQYPMMLGQYSITDGLIVTDRMRVYDLQANLLSERIFHTGFVLNDHAYYIVGDRGQDIRILRVCNHSTDQFIDDADSTESLLFRALYEVKLVCDGASVFAGASVVRDYPYPGNDILVLAVRSPDGTNNDTSRVCMYNTSDINTAMDDSLSECVSGENRRTVWGGSTSSLIQNLCGVSSVSCLPCPHVVLC